MSVLFRRVLPLTFVTSPTSAIIDYNYGDSYLIDIIATGNGIESLSFSVTGDTSYFSLIDTPTTISGGSTESFTVQYNGNAKGGGDPSIIVNIVGSGGNSTSVEVTGIPIS